jgi:hypothetical protein
VGRWAACSRSRDFIKQSLIVLLPSPQSQSTSRKKTGGMLALLQDPDSLRTVFLPQQRYYHGMLRDCADSCNFLNKTFIIPKCAALFSLLGRQSEG